MPAAARAASVAAPRAHPAAAVAQDPQALRRRLLKLRRMAVSAAALALSSVLGGFEVDEETGSFTLALSDEEGCEAPARAYPSATQHVSVVTNIDDYVRASAAAYAMQVRGWGYGMVAPAAHPLPLNPAASDVLANASALVHRLRAAGVPIGSFAAGKFSVWEGSGDHPRDMLAWGSRSVDRLRHHAAEPRSYVGRDGSAYHGSTARAAATVVVALFSGIDHQFLALALERRIHDSFALECPILDNFLPGPHHAGALAAASTHGAVYLTLMV